jgi:hypothetical protein
MWGAAVLLVGGAVVILADSLDQHRSALVEVVEGVAVVALTAFPLSIGVGVLRYRLYEIDRVISRTLAYAIVTGLLVGCYVGVVALGTDVLPFRGSVAVAVSTLAVAALFNPLRRQVQRVVHRRFNRASYDADQMITSFAARLQDAVELTSVRDDLLDAVNRSLEPTQASVWFSRDVGAQTDTGPPRRAESKSPVPSGAPAPGPVG